MTNAAAAPARSFYYDTSPLPQLSLRTRVQGSRYRDDGEVREMLGTEVRRSQPVDGFADEVEERMFLDQFRQRPAHVVVVVGDDHPVRLGTVG